MKQLISQITQILNETQDKTSVLIHVLSQDTPVFEKDSDIQMVSASTIKVPIMCCALEEVLQGNMTLDQMIQVEKEDILSDTEVFEHGPDQYSLEELISWMIISSDNTATNVLIRVLTMDKINDYIKNELHLNKTRVERIMLDFEAVKNGKNNYTSHQDQMSIYVKLFNHEILNDELCNKAIDILYNQRSKDLIMRYIPYRTPFAHKTGGLDYLVHDCGIMTLGDTSFYFGVSAWDCQDIDGNRALAGKIGRLVFNHYTK